MEELESQIAKIQISNKKTSSSYVYVVAEKSPVGPAELYVVAELPLLNPAAAEAHEKICLAIGSTLKRAYRKSNGGDAFENAIGQINEELGKLASLGQTNWIDRLSCILAVKDGHNLTIATVGKVSAFLFRGGEFTDISCSPNQSHPLKTFENYASGKIRLGDLLIFSTTQLFNYLSMDRIKDILISHDFLPATQTIIELLKANAGPEVAFASLLNLQIPPGQNPEEEVDLENYIVETPDQTPNVWAKIWGFVANAVNFSKAPRKPQIGLPKVALGAKLKTWGGNTKNFIGRGKNFAQLLGHGLKTGADRLDLANFKNFSRTKKFFFISALILLTAAIVNLAVSIKLKQSAQAQAKIAAQISQAQNFLNNAESSLLYKDSNSARTYLSQALNAMPKDRLTSGQNKAAFDKAQAQISDLQARLEKTITVQTEDLGSIGSAATLIKLPGLIAAQINNAILSYNIASGQLQDGTLKSPKTILSNAYLSGNLSAIFTADGLAIWDFGSGQLGPLFSQNVPDQSNFGGLAYYSTNKRIYVINKKSGQILSYLAGNNTLSKPVVAINDMDLSTAQSLAIDGNIYALTSSGVKKYLSGRLTAFSWPSLIIPFSGSGKIYTQKDYNYLYVLDSGNNRILVLDKKGGLINILKNDRFSKLKDFAVDEKNKVIYLLNDASLLKANLP